MALDPGRFARNPAGFVRSQPVTGALLIWALLVALAWARRGSVPAQQGLVQIALATGVVVAAAAVAGEVVFWVLLVGLLAAVLRGADDIAAGVRGFFADVQRALTGRNG